MNTTNFNGRQLGLLVPDALELALNPPRGIEMQWWPNLTRLMGGLRPHELTILCAPTGSGKTEFLAQLTTQLILQRIPSFVAPVETGDLDFANRVNGALCEMSFNSGEPVNLQVLQRRMEPFMDMLRDTKTIVSTHRNRVKVPDMITEMGYFRQEHGIQVATLDNLNFFLEVTRASDTLIEMDRAVHDFVINAQEQPVHTILVMHPKKTDGGRVESEFDIKGSSTAVQEADNVLLFNRPKPADVESGARSWNQRELVFKKIRRRGWNVNKPLWIEFQNHRYTEVENEVLRSPVVPRR